MTLDITDGVFNFITTKEVRIPAGVPFEIDTNIIIGIPDGMVLLITSDKSVSRRYGVYVNPSPLIISPDETSKTISIPVTYDGINRWGIESDFHGRVKVPANECIAKGILINVAQNVYTANIRERE